MKSLWLVVMWNLRIVWCFTEFVVNFLLSTPDLRSYKLREFLLLLLNSRSDWLLWGKTRGTLNFVSPDIYLKRDCLYLLTTWKSKSIMWFSTVNCSLVCWRANPCFLWSCCSLLDEVWKLGCLKKLRELLDHFPFLIFIYNSSIPATFFQSFTMFHSHVSTWAMLQLQIRFEMYMKRYRQAFSLQ